MPKGNQSAQGSSSQSQSQGQGGRGNKPFRPRVEKTEFSLRYEKAVQASGELEIKVEGRVFKREVGSDIRKAVPGVKVYVNKDFGGSVEVSADSNGNFSHVRREPTSAAGSTIILRFSLGGVDSEEGVLNIEFPPQPKAPAPPTQNICANQAQGFARVWQALCDLTPDHAGTRRIVEWMVVGLAVIVGTAAISMVCGYSVVLTWQYWIGLAAIGGLFTIMWLRKKTSMNGPYLALKIAAVVMIVSLLILAVWPKANIKNAAFSVKYPEYRKYDRGEYSLGLAEGRMSGWILPDGASSYDIKSADNQFMLITTEGAKIPSWDKANWPKNSPFQIYAITDQQILTLILK